MSTVDVHLVDPTDTASFTRWYEVIEASHRAAAPDEPGWRAVELRAPALNDDGVEQRLLLEAKGAGRAVGSGWMDLPRRDNLEMANLELYVHPNARRRGVGTALLRAAERLAMRRGRRTMLIEHREGSTTDDSPGHHFARACGYRCALKEIRRDLQLPVDARLLDDLERMARRAARGYQLVSWREKCPDDVLADRALMGQRMSTDAPMGATGWQEESWDGARVRAMEAGIVDQDRTLLAVAARQDEGPLVAFTELVVPRSAPQIVYQHDTLVLDAHRGHRLGLLMKVVNLRQLMEQFPNAGKVRTTNAETNGWMISVNHALGFKVTGALLEWRKGLDGSDARETSSV